MFHLHAPSISKIIFFSVLCVLLSTGCSYRSTLPIGIVPEQPVTSQEDYEYGRDLLTQLSSQYPLSHNNTKIERVQHVVDKLTRAIDGPKEPWNVYVFEAPEVKNAAATRGNHVFVWSGMLDRAYNDAELSTVLAHEMGHVLAGHVRPSPAEMVAQSSSQIGGAIAGGITSAYAGDGVGQVASMLAKLLLDAALVNPESQRQELEADQIGLFLLADAGYNPNVAVRFWERARDDPEFSSFDSVAFLSTHPSSADRYRRLEEMLPKAEERFLGITSQHKATETKKSNNSRSYPY
jgi:predicted Zn-dependent protease